ncbi:MAG: hypothetical protein ACLR1D_03940 [Dialister sp.]
MPFVSLEEIRILAAILAHAASILYLVCVFLLSSVPFLESQAHTRIDSPVGLDISSGSLFESSVDVSVFGGDIQPTGESTRGPAPGTERTERRKHKPNYEILAAWANIAAISPLKQRQGDMLKTNMKTSNKIK